MAPIMAISSSTDVVTGEVADQGLIEKARTPLLMNRAD